MGKISLHTTIQRKTEGLLASSLGNELVMMDIENGNYIGLNETGKVIWEMIEQPITVEALVQRLLERFAADKEQCSADTIEYLEKMHEQKIISAD